MNGLNAEISVKKIKGVDCYDKIPNGWVITDGATTAPIGYAWISNNKSRFSGERKIGLVSNEALSY